MENQDLLITTCQLSQQFSVCLWDYNNKNVIGLYKNGGAIPPRTLSVLEDYIIAAELNKPVLHAWPLNSQETDKNIRLILPGSVNCLSVCPRQTYLAVAIDAKLYIWQICSGKLLSVQQRHYQPITSIKYSSDSLYVAVGGKDGILVVYFLADLVVLHHSLLSQRTVGQVEPVYMKHDHSGSIVDLHIGSFGKNSRIATCSTDNTTKIYTLSTGDLLITIVFDETITTLLFDLSYWKLFVGTGTGLVKQLDLRKYQRTLNYHVEEETCNHFKGHTGKIVQIALNFSGSILASGADDMFVYTWDVLSRQILHKFDHKAPLTNIYFVPNFSHFTDQNLKPNLKLGFLERSIVSELNDFLVSLLQKDNIDILDDDTCSEKDTSNLKQENERLRIANAQLYKTALEISKKYGVLSEVK
ncbi:WD repeat-containing protein 18 [Anthonomus grandis grandis]|uniref:WD repeat-containing protein 18 n=1 Tax=Anthonomus grandis grandis TaxID=2921223 RepID=UPI00216532A8|nr:WD repeat-containing protein 18 [Anthonomus grandis grandis]XP_050316199.1 WD repeat-containing protein 18 [Anthonomus grandis grandis]